MKRFETLKRSGIKHISCPRKDDEAVVREGLSYSPSDMARLTECGMPVNSLNTQSVFFDGDENPSFHVTSDRTRHVDVCELWEEHVEIREKARAALKARKKEPKTE